MLKLGIKTRLVRRLHRVFEDLITIFIEDLKIGFVRPGYVDIDTVSLTDGYDGSISVGVPEILHSL